MLKLNKSTIGLLLKRNLFTFNSKNVKNNEYLDISEEVKYGLSLGKPVVALESTIVTHGMPYPENLKCALEVQQIVRQQGAIPASIGILNGKIKVGLSKNQLEYLADTKNNKAVKTSRRDLVYVIANKLNGGTTVSGTIVIAEKAGIPIFVTGGIGGVHRQGEKTFDISADLTELGRSSITVISSGVKSILDIPKTLEYLETQGVLVATYGPTNDFPAFYTRHSGSKTTYNVTNPKDAATLIATSLKLSLNSGNLIAVPVPEEFSFDSNKISAAIDEALLKADESDISGKEITPFLLSYIADVTSGRSLETNIALIKNNAEIGGQIAVSLSKLLNAEPSKESVSDKKICNNPVIIGASAVDCCIKLQEGEIKLDASTYNGSFAYSAGGVGRNVCDAMYKLGAATPTAFISAIGGDPGSELIKRSLGPLGSKLEQFIKYQTTHFIGIFDNSGECRMMVGNGDINNEINPNLIRKYEDVIKNSPLIIIDGNLSLDTLSCILKMAETFNVPVFFETTDPRKAGQPFKTPYWKYINFISPNISELRTILKTLDIFPTNQPKENNIDEALRLAQPLSQYLDYIIITLGSDGVLIVSKYDHDIPFYSIRNNKLHQNEKSDKVHARYYKTKKIETLVNVSGAGDCFTSGFISAMLNGYKEARCVSVGFEAAKTTLNSESAIPEKLFNDSHICWKTDAEFKQLY